MSKKKREPRLYKRPRHPLYFPKMKVRGSKERRERIRLETYMYGPQLQIDIYKINTAFGEVLRIATESLNNFVEAYKQYYTPVAKQSDYALASSESN